MSVWSRTTGREVGGIYELKQQASTRSSRRDLVISSHQRSSSTPQSSIDRRVANSSTALRKKTKVKPISRIGSAEPIAVIRKEATIVGPQALTAEKLESYRTVPLSSSLSSHSLPIVVFDPPLPSSDIDVKDKAPVDELSSRSGPIVEVNSEPLFSSLIEDNYFFKKVAHLVALKKGVVISYAHLVPFLEEMIRLLGQELEVRSCPFRSPRNLQECKEACIWLQKEEDAGVLACMERFRLDLFEEGYIFEKTSHWEILWILQTNQAAIDSIETVDFRELNIPYFPISLRGICLRKVQYLNCGKNKLKEIPEFLYNFVPDVKSISFNENELTKYPRHLFLHFKRLNQLELSRNKITKMPNFLGISVPEGQSYRTFYRVDLSNNQILPFNPGMILTQPVFKMVTVTIEMQGNLIPPKERGEISEQMDKSETRLLFRWELPYTAPAPLE